MKNYSARLQRLENLFQNKNEPVDMLIQEKKSIDSYYWNKMFELLSDEEINTFLNLEENQNSLKQLNRLIAI